MLLTYKCDYEWSIIKMTKLCFNMEKETVHFNIKLRLFCYSRINLESDLFAGDIKKLFERLTPFELNAPIKNEVTFNTK